MLYKYLPPSRVDVINDLKIRFSPLKSLNDPYESLPLLSIKEENIIKEESFTELNSFWASVADEEKNQENIEIYDKTTNDLIEHFETIFNKLNLAESLMEYFGDNYGVLSLSRTYRSLLMWSHYTDSGKGYVIGFNKSHHFFHALTLEGKITQPEAVLYSDTRQIISSDKSNLLKQVLCQKSLDWAYEQEERVFRACMDSKRSIGKDEFNLDIILHDIPKGSISEIIIGYQANERTQKKILDAIHKHKIKCDIYKASLSIHEYRIELTKISNKKPAI